MLSSWSSKNISVNESQELQIGTESKIYKNKVSLEDTSLCTGLLLDKECFFMHFVGGVLGNFCVYSSSLGNLR